MKTSKSHSLARAASTMLSGFVIFALVGGFTTKPRISCEKEEK